MAALSITIMAGSAQDAHAAAVRLGFDTNTFPRNDDSSTAPIDIEFEDENDLDNVNDPINFFGSTFLQLIINNNGNISFDSAISDFTPFDLSDANTRIIAPFFADVDTTFTGLPVTYGTGTVNGRDAFGVNWVDVDCRGVATPDDEIIPSPIPNPSATVFNSFQLILVERFDTGSGNFDMEFNYDSIKWDAGDASGGGETCVGGQTAIVGYSDGGANTFQFPGSDVSGSDFDGSLLDNGPNSLIQNSLNSNVLGRYIIPVRVNAEGIGTPNPNPVELIGGEILSINTTALLVTGAFANAFWMLPMLAGIAGTGLYLTRSRWNKA
jgi:hypothetical protein